MIDLSDRKDCFYWQTDRKLTSSQYAQIFLNRHQISTKILETIIKKGITQLGKITSVHIVSPDENVLKGNVNIVRKIRINDQPYVVRMHPNGVKNGYFYAEKLVLDLAQKHGIPSSSVVTIHEAVDQNDMDFMVMTLSPGITMDVLLSKDNSSEGLLLEDCGRKMAQIHQIKVKGFGPFDNQKAKNGELIGIHQTYKDFIHSGLKENIQRLLNYQTITPTQAESFHLFFANNNYEPIGGPRLVHNDFADWNVLCGNSLITAVLDWDESHAGDPVADLACWSTFFSLSRMEKFMEGYKSIGNLPQDFDHRFHFYRLRYTISKMALRMKRFEVDQNASLLERIANGKKALEEELLWLGFDAK